MLVGRSPARLSMQARTLARDFGVGKPRVEWYATDLTRPTTLAGLGDTAAAWGCNVVVHGAGVASFGAFESIGASDMVQALRTNLLAPMLLTQALLPHLRGLPLAQVICVGSALGSIGLPGYSVYSATKFGLHGFAEALRRELDDSTVRVQYLGPRSTRTDFNSAEVEAYNRATGTAMDSRETVAHAMLRLMEDEAAERFLGFPETLAVRLNGLAPTLLDRAFARHRRSVRPMSRPAASMPAVAPQACEPGGTTAEADSHSLNNVL
jgi:short-subunit dehydrogenase